MTGKDRQRNTDRSNNSDIKNDDKENIFQKEYAHGRFEIRTCECPVSASKDEYLGRKLLEDPGYSLLIKMYDDMVRTLGYNEPGIIDEETAMKAWRLMMKEMVVETYDAWKFERAKEVAQDLGWYETIVKDLDVNLE